MIKDDTKFKELVDDVTENESLDESDPYLPNPADAIDVPKNLKGGAEFHCELDEYAAMVQVQILTQYLSIKWGKSKYILKLDGAKGDFADPL